MEAPIPPFNQSDKKDYGLGALTWVLGIFFGILAPLIIWFIKKDDSSFIDKTGKNILNFHISYCIWSFASIILLFTAIALHSVIATGLLIFIILALWITMIFYGIIGASKARSGDSEWTPPFTINFI